MNTWRKQNNKNLNKKESRGSTIKTKQNRTGKNGMLILCHWKISLLETVLLRYLPGFISQCLWKLLIKQQIYMYMGGQYFEEQNSLLHDSNDSISLQCGWYWGPLNWDKAEAILAAKPSGSFLVRDSSDDRYILSLSFRSQGKTHHTRIEHYKGEWLLLYFR